MSIRTALISSFLALAIIALTAFVYVRNESPQSRDVVTKVSRPSSEEVFQFEIADTEAARMQGLSGRREMLAGHGLLFVFDRPERYGFWMKDMLMSIDIIWLADDGTILAIEEGVSPDTYPTAFHPPVPVKFVLETRVGEAKAQGWTVGTRIQLPQ